MSVEHTELVLHELTTKRESRKAYRDDPQGYLATFVLSDDERAMILGGDVRALYRAGVSPLLVMGFWIDTMRRPLTQYVGALHAAPQPRGGK